MPVAQYPDIVPPQVSVTTIYPGANAAVVDATVAQPIEAQVVGVDKMIYMKSTSGDDGSYTLTASFELGTDPDINTVNVNNRVQTALSQLPPEVQRQGVTVKKKSSAMLGVIALYSPKQTHDPLFLSNYVTINLLDPIKSTPGVGDATLFGPAGLCHAGLGADRPADRPQSDHRRHHQRHPVAERPGRGRAHRRAADLQRPATPAQHPDQGPPDIGRGFREHRHPHQSRRIGAAAGRRRAGWNSAPPISTAKRASTADLPPRSRSTSRPAPTRSPRSSAVRDKLAELQKRFPDDLAWKITYDPTIFVTDTMHEVKKTLIEAFVLVVIVVFLFLGSVRATLDPDACRAGQPDRNLHCPQGRRLFGQYGLAARDRARHRHRRRRRHRGGRERRAGDGGASGAVARRRRPSTPWREITAPIIAITLVLLSVFVPIAFIPGISGELFRQFAVTVAVSMFLSAINALTLSPALCGVLLKPHHGPRRGIIGWLMRSIDRVRDGYGAVVARIVRFSVIGIVMVAVAGAGAVGLAKVTPTGFLPEDDQGALFVVVQLPGGASVGADVGSHARRPRISCKDEAAVEDYTSVIGLNFIDNYSQPNAAFMVVTLKPFEERKSQRLGARRCDRAARRKFRQIQRRAR